MACTMCHNKFAYPPGHEKVRCPHCHEVVEIPEHARQKAGSEKAAAAAAAQKEKERQAAEVEAERQRELAREAEQEREDEAEFGSSKADGDASEDDDNREVSQAEQHYYDVLGTFKEHFDRPTSGLVWLARATPTRSNKLSIPKAFRWPKSNSGQGGYATAFRKLGLMLRETDTKSGHWHYWYLDPKKVKWKELQKALRRRWRESHTYADQAAELCQLDGLSSADSDVRDFKRLLLGLRESMDYNDRVSLLRQQMNMHFNKRAQMMAASTPHPPLMSLQMMMPHLFPGAVYPPNMMPSMSPYTGMGVPVPGMSPVPSHPVMHYPPNFLSPYFPPVAPSPGPTPSSAQPMAPVATNPPSELPTSSSSSSSTSTAATTTTTSTSSTPASSPAPSAASLPPVFSSFSDPLLSSAPASLGPSSSNSVPTPAQPPAPTTSSAPQQPSAHAEHFAMYPTSAPLHPLSFPFHAPGKPNAAAAPASTTTPASLPGSAQNSSTSPPAGLTNAAQGGMPGLGMPGPMMMMPTAGGLPHPGFGLASFPEMDPAMAAMSPEQQQQMQSYLAMFLAPQNHTSA
eukprot:TRINITY_DN1967_c0_g1_i10.p1 TRINITY_DN1967_c0_g1~~TRINITY_DN1967_c0_g1_i10.p1  ORF type:complete len:570 (-),score=189.97 TRINITY_DN1967_c0_g1_i10:304-2013(-)